MKSVVTGGAGFIGSHIVDALVGLKHEVVVIDNLSSEVHDEFYFNPSAQYLKEDIADYDRIRPAFDGADYVFHLAAEARIQLSINNPLLCVRTNGLGTATVLQCARSAGVKRVVYSSTSSSYGRRNKTPLVETMATDCLNPYSATKVYGEGLCKVYSDLYGLDTVVFRYFNAYGPREPQRGPYAPVVGLFLRQWRGGEPLTIVPDGHQRRDFTHVWDIVRANILAISREGFEGRGEVFNVGTGRNHSVLELAAMISPNTVFVAERPGEARETLADNTKILGALGWSPSIQIEDYVRGSMAAAANS